MCRQCTGLFRPLKFGPFLILEFKGNICHEEVDHVLLAFGPEINKKKNENKNVRNNIHWTEKFNKISF